MSTPLMLQFDPNVSLDDVLEAVKIAYGRAGCSPCGRLSLYLHAQEVIDPAIAQLRGLKSIVNVGELAPNLAVQTFQAR